MPRWGLPEVSFVETNPERIQAEIIAGYEAASGRVLANADPIRTFLLSIADIIIQLKQDLNFTGRQNLLTYATGEYLDALGALMRVSRLPAAKAQTTIRVTLSKALGEVYSIPAGYQVTNGDIVFSTNEEGLIPEGELTVDIPATCETAGAAGNGFLPGELSTPIVALAFVKSAENITETSGGSEIESDDALAERIHDAPNSFSVAGPAESYKYHAFSVSSDIIDVSVVAPEADPGTVNVYLLTKNGNLASEELKAQVLEHLSGDTIRPLTDSVHVLDPDLMEIAPYIDYSILKENQSKGAEIRANIEKAFQDYITWQEGKIGRDIDQGRLTALLDNAGAVKIWINGLGNVELERNQVARVNRETSVLKFNGYVEG